MTTLLKLGGSLVTDKRSEKTFRRDVVRRIASEVRNAVADAPQDLVIGHGSGSFGHVAANKYDTITGVSNPEQWRGFADVALVASELNYLVTSELWAAGLPVMRMQPSVALLAEDGVPIQMDTTAIRHALRAGLIPVVHGDVAFDTVRGGTIISTEALFTHLVSQLPVQTIILAGEVAGVLDRGGGIIHSITPANAESFMPHLTGSSGTDVTGGMLTKVADMLRLVNLHPRLHIRIVNGQEPDAIYHSLVGDYSGGTRISSD